MTSGFDRPFSAARFVPVACSLALVALGASATDLRGQDECTDVSGAWAVQIAFPQGAQDVTLTFEQDECAITGIVKGTRETPIEEGSVDGSTFRFLTNVTNETDGSALTITWVGTREGDAVSGTLDLGGMGSVTFSGKRADP